MDPRLTYGSLLVPSVPSSQAAVAAGLHHPQNLHPYQLTPSVHHLAHPLHPFSQASTVSHHLKHHESSPSSSSTTGSNSNINPVTGKVKRARQRVDAGEPRNSYASITNFSSTRSSAFHHPGKSSGSGLHSNRASGVVKSTSSSSISSSTPSSSSCLSKSQSSGLSYALSSPSTCSSCSFCSNNQSHHHHNRSSSSHLLQSSSSNSGGSGIGIQCNDKMTSQYKENQINFNKQQNVDNIVSSLTSSNSNFILGVHSVGGSGSASGINNINNMYHNGQSSQQSKQFVHNYPDESNKQQSLISFEKTSSVPSSPLTSPIPLSSSSSSSSASSSAHLLRVILQKGRRAGSSNSIKSDNNQVNCDKIGANCETRRKKANDINEEKDDEDDEETDSGRTITGSPVNNGEEGGDKVDDEDDNLNNDRNEKNNNEDDTNDVEASCSVESEGEPDGGDYSSGRGSNKPDRYDLDTDEYNNDIMSLNGDSKNDSSNNHDKNDSTLLSTFNEIKCNNDNESTPDLPLNCDNHDQLSSYSQSTTVTSTVTTSTLTTSTTSANNSPTISDVKRARVENIVTNMLPRSNSTSDQFNRSTIKDQQQSSSIVNGCKKRKLYHPQQTKSNGSLEDDEDDFLDEIIHDDDEEEEDDEINDSLIGLSSNTLGDYEMSEINDLSIKPSIKCEKDDEEMKKSSLSPTINQEETSTSLAKYETSSSQINLNKSSDNHDSAQAHRQFSGLQDPAQLLNEARKLVYEQEKMTKENSSSHESHHHHHHHHHRQSRSSRKRQFSSLPHFSNPTNGIGTESLLPTAKSPPIYYSDIEWLRDTLKTEMQAHLIPSFSEIIDSVINRFCQRRVASSASRTSSLQSSSHQYQILPIKEPGDIIIQRNSESSAPETSKELTLLSQMLESKSPRTSHGKASESSDQQSQPQSNHHHSIKTNVPRDSSSQNNYLQHSSLSSNHHSHHRQSNTPVYQMTGGSNGPNNKSSINGNQQHLFPHLAHHRGSSNSPSSFTLSTENAPVPKPSGPSPFTFPPVLKSNLLFPNFPTGLPGAAAVAAASQHLNSFPSVFHHHQHQQQQQQQSSQQRSSGSDAFGILRDQSTPTATETASVNFLEGNDNQNKPRKSREGSPVDSEHARASSVGDNMSPSEVTSGGEQTEAISLVVTPKRKRLKVTDSKIAPRTVNRITQEPLLANLMARGELPSSSSPPPPLNFNLTSFNGPPLIGPPTVPPPPLVPVSLPTSVAISNTGLHSAELFANPVFPFSDHVRLLRESIFCQAAAAAAAAASSGQTENNDREKDNSIHHETSIKDSQISSQHQQSQSRQSPQQKQEQDQNQQSEQLQQQQRDDDVHQRHHHHHHHPLHHHQTAQQQKVVAVAAAAAAAAAQQHHHHQAATAAAIHNALAANHLAMLAQANRASGGGDTASPESLSQFGGTISENGVDGSESLNDSTGYDTSTPLMSFCGNSLALQTTLTPMHLRKAKLMFFYVRYPSSNVLKTFFPDIKFNKNNTAQLVKWFSNFREFYYIQMEKYARQAITEGIKSADDIHISREQELLRVLNMHYNRSNHLDVPERFCFVVEQTLKEFFKSILAGKDNEQSWKKAIYKIISRLDDSVPEYFKSPNFLERLE